MAHPPAPWPSDGRKTCRICGERKAIGQFYKMRAGMYGVMANCKLCTNAKRREAYKEWPIELKRRYHAGEKARKAANPAEYKLRKRKETIRTYGITYEQFLQYQAAQDHCCLICKRHRNLVIDHDHKTGKYRGLLCVPCNTGLGQFRDLPSLMRKAARYVEKHTKTQFQESAATQAIRGSAGERKDYQRFLDDSWLQREASAERYGRDLREPGYCVKRKRTQSD